VGSNAVTVDENGLGFFNGSSMPGALGTDPTNSTTALVYNLPAGVLPVAGDVGMTEPGLPNAPPSDLVRFTSIQLPAGGSQGLLIFYSDIEVGVPKEALADVGMPSNTQTNFFPGLETGPEAGPNGLVYVPTAGQPGFIAGSITTYNFQSDPVPEPGSVVLLALGGLALAGRTLVRRRARGRVADAP
jgi:hypothetical protein